MVIRHKSSAIGMGLSWLLLCNFVEKKSTFFLNKRETERIEGAKAKLIKLVTLSQGF